MKKSRTEIEREIINFFNSPDLKEKTPKDVKKIKKLAMSRNIPLKDFRKLFCKKCFHVYKFPKIRINNKIKTVVCENCDDISRWKVKD